MTIQQAWRSSLGSLALLAAFGPVNLVAADEGREPAVPPPPAGERKEVRPPAPPQAERSGPERTDRRAPEGPDRAGPRDEGRRRDGGEDGRLDRLKRDAQRLRSEGKAEDAARVEKEFRDALTKMLKYALPQLPEEVRGKLQPKIDEYLKARDEGKYEDAERIEKEAKEIMKPFEDKIIEPNRKIHHLRGAVDNLRAAGLNDLAEKLSEQLRQLEQEFGVPPQPEGGRRDEGRGPPDARGTEGRGPEGRRPDARGPDDRGPEGRGPEVRNPDKRGPDRRGPDGDNVRRGDNRGNPGDRDEARGTDPQQELFRVLKELRNDVENLRREVQELRNRPGQPEPRKPRE